MKPALNRKKNSARIDEQKLFQYIQGTLRLLKMPRHLTLNWCENNLPNFITQEEWSCNFPDLNCVQKSVDHSAHLGLQRSAPNNNAPICNANFNDLGGDTLDTFDF